MNKLNQTKTETQEQSGRSKWRRVKWIKGIDHMVIDGIQSFVGEHDVVYTEVAI